MKRNFSYKKLRIEYFSKYFPYDNELGTIICKEKSYDFLKDHLVQNMHIYLIEYLLSFTYKWFNKNDFTVLDWGCGKCQVSYLLKKRNINVLSCDVNIPKHDDSAFGQNTPIAEHAKINVIPLNHKYIMPFANESFDVVLSFGVLEHVRDDKKSLEEINRILRPNGLFFCFWLPYKYSWRQNWIKLRGNNYHDRLYVMNKVKHLLDETRFNILDYWYRDLLPFRGRIFGRKNFRIMEDFDNWLCRNTFVKHFAANIEFVANKK